MSETKSRTDSSSISVIIPHYTDESIRYRNDQPYDSVGATSYGLINFPDNKSNRAQFIRIPDNAQETLVKTLLVDHWFHNRPSLVISVTGGANDFKMEPRLLNAFRRGLLKVAKTTSAWIITGGMDRGVMKLVGEISHLNRDRAHPIPLIGIATWGCVAGVESLEGKGVEVQYIKSNTRTRGTAPLEANHTHFIFVDNGSKCKFGGEIAFRARLERALAEDSSFASTIPQAENVSPSLPSMPEQPQDESFVVLLVFEGGPNTVRTIHEAVVRHRIPAVILEGTGRCCDLFAKALRLYREYQKTFDQSDRSFNFDLNALKNYEDEIKHKLRHELRNELASLSDQKPPEKKRKTADRSGDGQQSAAAPKNEESVDHFELVYECIHSRAKLLNIVNFKSKSSADPDLDVGILKALLTAKSDSEGMWNNDIIKAKQFQLALAWNRVDIAKNHIVYNLHNWANKDEYIMMFRTALKNDQTEFVKLFLDGGLSLSQAFKYDLELQSLYEDKGTKYDDLTRRSIKSSKDMHRYIIQHILGESYEISAPPPVVPNTPGVAGPIIIGKGSNRVDFDKELFLWSVIRASPDLNYLFWSRSKNKICGALMAALIYRKRYRKDRNMIYSQTADKFVELAVRTLNRLYHENMEICIQAITRQIPSYGNITWLDVAVAADAKPFIAQRPIQDVLNRIWFRGIDTNVSVNQIIFSTICIAYSPFLFRRHRAETLTQPSQPTPKQLSRFLSTEYPSIQKVHRPDDTVNTSLLERSTSKGIDLPEKLSVKDVQEKKWCHSIVLYFKRIMAFVRTPYVKYLYHLYFHILFLLLFSYVILNNFFPLYDFDMESCAPKLIPGRLKETNEAENNEKNLTQKEPPYGSQWKSRPASAEILLAVWVFTLLCEEIRQLNNDDARSFRSALVRYLSQFWNRLDVLAIILFYIGFILRFLPIAECFCTARIILAIDLTIWFIRSLDLCAAIQQLGPKLVMISSMIRDLKVYMLMLIVFIFGFGVSSYSLIHGVQPFSWHLPREIMNLAYWEMFGDLNALELFENNYKPNGYVVFILTTIYMALVSILLVNLLIAMFSNTFDRVQSDTDQIWKFQRYSLICEYLSRPSLPPPFICFSHTYRLVLRVLSHSSMATKIRSMYQEHLNRIKYQKKVEPNTSAYIETIEDALGDEVYYNFVTRDTAIDEEDDIADEKNQSSQDILMKKVRTLENRMQQIVMQQSFMCEYLDCLMDGLQAFAGENIRMPRRRFDRDLYDPATDSLNDLRPTSPQETALASPTQQVHTATESIFTPRGD